MTRVGRPMTIAGDHRRRGWSSVASSVGQLVVTLFVRLPSIDGRVALTQQDVARLAAAVVRLEHAADARELAPARFVCRAASLVEETLINRLVADLIRWPLAEDHLPAKAAVWMRADHPSGRAAIMSDGMTGVRVALPPSIVARRAHRHPLPLGPCRLSTLFEVNRRIDER